MAKEIGQFMKNVPSFSDGQLKVLDVDWEESQWITLEITPNAGPYKGGTYQFKVGIFTPIPSSIYLSDGQSLAFEAI